MTTTSQQRLTFWCLRHREVCHASRTEPQVICEQGNEVLSENFLRDKWHYCCGCETFFACADNEAANKVCPACANPATWRYLCDNCQVFSFEAESRLRQRAFAFGPTGTPPATCPGCLQAPQTQLYEHLHCPSFNASFKTARPVCPFCGDRLSAPPRTNYDFLSSFRKPLAEYLGNMSPSAIRAEVAAPGSLVAVAHGRFWLTQFRDEKTFIVFPEVRQFGAAQDYQLWQNVFECERPGAGEVWLEAPAVAMLDSLTHQYQITQKGKLEVQVKATVPLPTPPQFEPPKSVFARPAIFEPPKSVFTRPTIFTDDQIAEIESESDAPWHVFRRLLQHWRDRSET